MGNEAEKKYKERILFAALDFFKRDFEVSDAEISKILNVENRAVRSWFRRRRVNLNNDENLEKRIALLIGIHWNLVAMFSTSKNRMLWLKTPHPDMYAKMPPMEVMFSPGGLSALNSYTIRAVGEGA